MTAPSSPVALLDQLDELRANATPGPWEHEHEDYGDEWWFGGSSGPGQETINGCIVTDAGHAADASLIVGAVNAVGPLTAAVRAVLELADSWAALEHWDYKGPEKLARARADSANDAARILRDHVTAALSVTP